MYLLLLTLACATHHPTVQTEATEQSRIEDSARLYWEGRRWNDSDKAAAFIEEPHARLLFKEWMEDDWERYRVTDALIMQVVLAPPASDPAEPRTATVHVRVKGYSMPAQVLDKQNVEQEWYRTPTGWWLEWTPPEQESE